METLLVSADMTIAAMQQTLTRGIAAAFSGMSTSSPACTRADPVHRTLFPAANTAKPPQLYCPNPERLQMIRAARVVIHPAGRIHPAAH